MLVIRAEQLASFAREIEALFEEEMMEHLAGVFPSRKHNVFRPIIRAGIAKAKGYGIEDKRSVAQLITIMVGIGPDFDELPDYGWAKQVLGDQSVEPDARVDMVVEVIVERDDAGIEATGAST